MAGWGPSGWAVKVTEFDSPGVLSLTCWRPINERPTTSLGLVQHNVIILHGKIHLKGKQHTAGFHFINVWLTLNILLLMLKRIRDVWSVISEDLHGDTNLLHKPGLRPGI